MATPAELLAELLKMPATVRAEAAQTLLESLDGEDDPAVVEAEWQREIARRVRAVEDGEVQLVDGPAALQAIRDRLRARGPRSGQ